MNSVCDAHFENFIGKQRQLIGNRLECQAGRAARNPHYDAAIDLVDLGPVGLPLPCCPRRDAFFDPCRDHLCDVTPADRDPLANQAQRPCLGFDLGRQGFEFLRAHDEGS